MQIKKSIPVALWIAIIGMGIFAVVHLISSFSQPMQMIAFLTNLILLIGLYNGKKWAYIFAIIASLFIPSIILLINHLSSGACRLKHRLQRWFQHQKSGWGCLNTY